MNAARLPSIEDDHQALIRFLYLAPVGRAPTSTAGEIVSIDPISAPLRMPIVAHATPTSLLTALQPVAPERRHPCAGFDPPHGGTRDALRIQVHAGAPGKSDP